MLPNTFIIGAAKSATSTLSYWLSQNPNVCLAYGKENYFFSRDYFRGPKWLEKNFYKHYTNEKIILDATATHQVLKFVPPRIKEICPNAKIILCVRSPIERAFSHWNMYKSWRVGRVHDNFIDAIYHNIKSFNKNKFQIEGDYVAYMEEKGSCYIPSFIEEGMYNTNILEYEKYFKEILVINFNDFSKQPRKLYTIVCDFLKIYNFEIDYSKHDPNTKTNLAFNDILIDHSLMEFLKKIYIPEIKAINKKYNVGIKL